MPEASSNGTITGDGSGSADRGPLGSAVQDQASTASDGSGDYVNVGLDGCDAPAAAAASSSGDASVDAAVDASTGLRRRGRGDGGGAGTAAGEAQGDSSGGVSAVGERFALDDSGDAGDANTRTPRAVTEMPHPGRLPENIYNNGMWRVRAVRCWGEDAVLCC